MTKNTRKLKISVMFLITALSVVFCQSSLFAKKDYREIKEVSNEEVEQMAEEKAKGDSIVPAKRPKVEYQAGNLKDPFEGPIVKETDVATAGPGGLAPQSLNLAVQGVIWGGNFPQAIINNKVVKVGDTIEGAKVVSIEKDAVAVFTAGRQYNLPSPSAGGAPNQKP